MHDLSFRRPFSILAAKHLKYVQIVQQYFCILIYCLKHLYLYSLSQTDRLDTSNV